MIYNLFIGFAILLISIYFYLTRNYGYWKGKGVPFIQTSFPFGIAQDQFKGKQNLGMTLTNIYNQYKKKGLKYVGAFQLQQPALILLDLELIKHVMTKDFSHFVSRDSSPVTHEYMSKHLFALEGQEWRSMRRKLTPTFTSGKMKNMFSLMVTCAHQLQEHIQHIILKQGDFEVKRLLARFTTDIIATCAFGLETNSLKNEDDEFFKVGQLIFVPKSLNVLKTLMYKNFPFITTALKIDFFHPKVSDTLTKMIKDTIEYRTENVVNRNDFIDLLLKVKENKLKEDDDRVKEDQNRLESKEFCESHNLKRFEQEDNIVENNDLTVEQMTAQAFVFFAAGFETAASTTSFCLYELAKNPDIQRKVHEEMDRVLMDHGGELSYGALQAMTYMDQVVDETLRMYGSFSFLTRVCTRRYRIPDTDLVIDEGVRVNIPTYGIHHDPDLYPDPYTFDPERFSKENTRNRHPYAFLPFGEGPRNCIGMRFGRLQVKAGLVAILSRHQLTPAPDTPSVMEFSPRIIFTIPKHPFRLRIAERTDIQ